MLKLILRVENYNIGWLTFQMLLQLLRYCTLKPNSQIQETVWKVTCCFRERSATYFGVYRFFWNDFNVWWYWKKRYWTLGLHLSAKRKISWYIDLTRPNLGLEGFDKYLVQGCERGKSPGDHTNDYMSSKISTLKFPATLVLLFSLVKRVRTLLNTSKWPSGDRYRHITVIVDLGKETADISKFLDAMLREVRTRFDTWL